MRWTSLARHGALALCLATCVLPPVANAVVLEVTAVMLALTGGDILKAAEVKVNQKMAEVKSYGNGLVSQGVAGLNIGIQGARVNAEALLDKPLRELKESERNIFLRIKEATDTLDDLADKAYRLEEVANVDASLLLGQIPLIKDATFISSIGGLSVLQGDRDHKVTVVGTGLGPGADGVVARIDVLRGGRVLQPSRVDSSKHNTTAMYFSPQSLRAI